MSCFDKALNADQDYADAWEGKGKCLKALGDEARGCLYVGMALHQKGRHDEALVEVDKALDVKKRYIEAWANRAQILEAMERYEEAVESYDRAIDIHPGTVDLYQNKAILLYQKMDRKREGLKCFQRVVALDSARWFKLPKEIREGMEKL